MARFSNDDLYAPCFCGSGKKLKFCCLKTAIPVGPPVSSAEDALVDRALRLVNAGHRDDARTLLEDLAARGTQNVSALNTLVVLRFSTGEEHEAITLAERLWTRVCPGNAFTGGSLAHALASVGRVVEAHTIADKLVRLPIPADSHGHAVVCALGALGRDADVVAVANKTPEPRSFVVLFARAVALVNMGRLKEARPALLRAMETGPHETPYLRGLLAELDRGRVPSSPWGRQPLLPPAAWLPGDTSLVQLRDAASDEAIAAMARRFPLMMEVPKQLALAPDKETRRSAFTLLARMGTDVARDALLAVAGSAWGDDETRMDAAIALVQEGLHPPGAPIHLRMNGKVQEVIVNGAPRHAQAALGARQEALAARFEVPDEIAEEYARALECSRRGDHAAALRALEGLERRVPRHPSIRFNVIVTRVQVNGDQTRAERELRALLAEHPDYLFARAQLATLLVKASRVQEAKEALSAEHLHGPMHPEWAGMAMLALGRVAMAEGELKLASKHVAAARKAGVDVERAAPDLMLAANVGAFMEDKQARADAKEAKRRQRVIDEEGPLPAWFADQTVEEIRQIFRRHRTTSSGSRTQLLQRLQVLLEHPETVEWALDHLSPAARRAWDDLLREGWSIPCDAFDARHAPKEGSLAKRRASSAGKADPSTALHELRAFGLVVVGALRGVPSVVVLPVVRATMRRIRELQQEAVSEGLTWMAGTVELPPMKVSPTRDGHDVVVAPLVVLVMTSDRDLVAMDVCSGEPLAAVLERALRQGLSDPLSGASPRAPDLVVVPDEAMRVAARRVFDKETMVEVGDVSAVRAAASDLDAYLREAAGARATYFGPGVTEADMAALFEAAAALHACAPWEVAPDDGCLFRLVCAEERLDVVVSVTGQLGEALGIVLYRDLAGYEEWREVAVADDGTPELLPEALALQFDVRAALPPALVVEAARHRWKVASAEAMPILLKTGGGTTDALATGDEVRRITLAARALEALIVRDAPAVRRMDAEPTCAFAPVELESPGGRRRVSVRGVIVE